MIDKRFVMKEPCEIPPKPKSNNKKARRTKYRTVSWPGHPLSQKDGKVYAHRAVLYEKIGPGRHPCYRCGKELMWNSVGKQNLNVDHLDNNKWNNSPSNLMPVCRGCNARKSLTKTHCIRGHRFTKKNSYYRPDGAGKQCRICNKERETKRVRR